ncbi:DUF1302 domain-containing protein [Parvibaculum sp.]|uniref:DUF1302 domain-containing protein n=1 Tax=Parvibaculum sp. TaxID=2024848 RepID=UPI00320F1FC9
MKYRHGGRGVRGRLACAFVAYLASMIGGASAAGAVEWKIGEVDVNVKTTASVGVGIRMVNPDGDLISVLNGGRDTSIAAENFDDGNLNYKRGDVYTTSTRMLHEVDIRWQNLGAFSSFSYFYDFMNNDAESTRRTDLSHDARQQAGRGIDLYDAYVYGDFNVGGAPLTLRLGNQVINWGEALFRPGGIAQTNAIDISKLVTPGTNIREGYLPSPMIYANFSPVQGLGLEAYYEFEWRKTKLIPVGTFHSTEDLLGDGNQGMFFAGDPGGTGLTPQQLFLTGTAIPRGPDDNPKNGGQYGVAARYFADDLALEASLYYLRYHSKTPYLSGTAFCIISYLSCFVSVPTSYYAVYPEDNNLYGASLSFPIGPVAIGAEASYQPRYPVMLADAVTAAITEAWITGLPSSVDGVTYAKRWSYIGNAALTIGPNLGAIGQLPGWIGADSMDLYGEAALVSFAGDKPAGVTGDMSAWGLTTVASATYTNVLMSGLTLTPNVSFNYNVNGTAIDRSSAGTPIRGKRAVAVGVSANLRNTYSGSITYTNNMGGGLITRNSDRDFLTIAAAYSF